MSHLVTLSTQVKIFKKPVEYKSGKHSLVAQTSTTSYNGGWSKRITCSRPAWDIVSSQSKEDCIKTLTPLSSMPETLGSSLSTAKELNKLVNIRSIIYLKLQSLTKHSIEKGWGCSCWQTAGLALHKHNIMMCTSNSSLGGGSRITSWESSSVTQGVSGQCRVHKTLPQKTGLSGVLARKSACTKRIHLCLMPRTPVKVKAEKPLGTVTLGLPHGTATSLEQRKTRTIFLIKSSREQA